MHVEELHVLLRQIIENVAPTELAAFNIEGEQLIADQIEGRRSPSIDKDKTNSFAFGLGDLPLGTISEYVRIIGGTVSIVKALGWIRASGKKTKSRTLSLEELGELRIKWENELIKYGLSKPRAEKIARTFVDNLVEAASNG